MGDGAEHLHLALSPVLKSLEVDGSVFCFFFPSLIECSGLIGSNPILVTVNRVTSSFPYKWQQTGTFLKKETKHKRELLSSIV